MLHALLATTRDTHVKTGTRNFQHEFCIKYEENSVFRMRIKKIHSSEENKILPSLISALSFIPFKFILSERNFQFI